MNISASSHHCNPNKKWSFVLPSLLTVALCGSLGAAGLPKCDTMPLIDGAEDKAWETARVFKLFSAQSGDPLGMDTTARLMYDDQNLYAFVTCREVNLVEARDQMRYGGHDSEVWGNDCVEFFLDIHGNGRSFYQFVVDIHGDTADLLHHAPENPGNALEWNGFWRHAAGSYPDGWTVEVAIPWRTLGFGPGEGLGLGFNISRARRVAPYERGTLAAGTKSISKPEFFPRLEGIDIDKPAISAEILPSPVYMGDNDLTLRLQNISDGAPDGFLALDAIHAESGEALFETETPLSLAAGEERVVKLPYRVDMAGRVQITASFRSAEGIVFLDLADYVFRQPVELNLRRALVFKGRDCPVYVRVFVNEKDRTLAVELFPKGSGELCARTGDASISKSGGFVQLPTASLDAGEYTAKIILERDGGAHVSELPVTIVKRP